MTEYQSKPAFVKLMIEPYFRRHLFHTGWKELLLSSATEPGGILFGQNLRPTPAGRIIMNRYQCWKQYMKNGFYQAITGFVESKYRDNWCNNTRLIRTICRTITEKARDGRANLNKTYWVSNGRYSSRKLHPVQVLKKRSQTKEHILLTLLMNESIQP